MPTQAGSAFETVVVVVFERFEGVLDIVRHHALVRAASQDATSERLSSTFRSTS